MSEDNRNCRSKDLGRELKESLRPAYLFVNDEPVLLNEDRDRVRQALGCEQRHLFEVDQHFDFAVAIEAATAPNLFGEAFIVELLCVDDIGALRAGKLVNLAKKAREVNTPLMVACAGLGRSGKSAWQEELEDNYFMVKGDDVDPQALPGWIRYRSKRAGINLDDEAIGYLANLTEGNLSMAAQEIDKLLMAHGAGASVDLAMIRGIIADQTQDSLMFMRDSMASGDTYRAVRSVRFLRAMDPLQAPLVVWALADEGRQLLALMKDQRTRGLSGKHAENLRNMANRVEAHHALAFLAGVARADWAAKGMIKNDPWILIERLVTAFTLMQRQQDYQTFQHLVET